MLGVLRWYFSGFYNKPRGLKKPLNPLLGEVHRAVFEHPGKGARPPTRCFYVAEQVCHHPPTTALAVVNREAGWVMDGGILCRSKFWGNSAASLHESLLRLRMLRHNEEYHLTLPDYYVKGLLIGRMITEFGGQTSIECKATGLRAEINFRLKPKLGGTYNTVDGTLFEHDKPIFKLGGRWDRGIQLTPASSEAAKPEPLIEINEALLRRRLKRKTVPFAEQRPYTEEAQGTFGSFVTWEDVSQAIRAHDQPAAVKAKRYLEDSQRRKAKVLAETKQPFIHRLFEGAGADWHYKHLELRDWDPAVDGYAFELDGIVATLPTDQVPPPPAPALLSPPPPVSAAARSPRSVRKPEPDRLTSGSALRQRATRERQPRTPSPTAGKAPTPRREPSAELAPGADEAMDRLEAAVARVAAVQVQQLQILKLLLLAIMAVLILLVLRF